MKLKYFLIGIISIFTMFVFTSCGTDKPSNRTVNKQVTEALNNYIKESSEFFKCVPFYSVKSLEKIDGHFNEKEGYYYADVKYNLLIENSSTDILTIFKNNPYKEDLSSLEAYKQYLDTSLKYLEIVNEMCTRFWAILNLDIDKTDTIPKLEVGEIKTITKTFRFKKFESGWKLMNINYVD